VQVLNFVKKPRNYGKVRGMVGDVIAEIPKENPVVRLTENWMNVGQSKFVKIAGSLMIIVFDEFKIFKVSLLNFWISIFCDMNDELIMSFMNDV
jgi:hypothetical protein